MAKKLDIETANRLLSDVPPEKGFYVFNGPVVKNLDEFFNALAGMSDEQFSYHRNNMKNDFYNWIIDVIGDTRLANEFGRTKTRETALKKVKDRIDALKKIREGKNGE